MNPRLVPCLSALALCAVLVLAVAVPGAVRTVSRPPLSHVPASGSSVDAGAASGPEVLFRLYCASMKRDAGRLSSQPTVCEACVAAWTDAGGGPDAVRERCRLACALP